MNKLAVDIPLSPPDGFTGRGTIGAIPSTNAPARLTEIISTAIAVMTIIAFIWFIIQFFIGAIQIMSSNGDKAAVSAAKSKLSTSVVGLVVVISSIFIIELIGFILGFNILTSITDLLS